MASATDRAKRALVVVIKYLAAAYGLQADVTRDSKDDLVRKAYRTVSLKVHPDKGGKEEDQRKLNGAYDSWCEAARAKSGQGRPKKQAAPPATSVEVSVPVPEGVPGKRDFEINAGAVLFTYQGFADVAQWGRFLGFVRAGLSTEAVQYWTRTETGTGAGTGTGQVCGGGRVGDGPGDKRKTQPKRHKRKERNTQGRKHKQPGRKGKDAT